MSEKDNEKKIAGDILVAYLHRPDSKIKLEEPDKVGEYFENIYGRVKKVSASLEEKRVAADLLVAFFQKSDSKLPFAEADKIGDYFDIICQHVSN